MKIMLVVARLNVGGVALNLVQMAHAFQEAGAEVLLVNGLVGESEGDMQYLVERYKIPQVVIPSLGRELSPRRDLFTIWQLWRLMREFRPDVVHTHTAKAGFVGRWAAWLAGVRVRVHTFHGHVFSGYFSPRKTQFFLRMEQLSSRISSRVITLSQSLKTELSEIYHAAPSEKIAVIPLGLDLSPFIQAKPGAFRNQYSLSEETLIIAVVGRLVPIKNHRLFLEAASLAAAKQPGLHFAIIGDGELRGEIESEIKSKGLAATVTGWAQDVAAYYPDFNLVTITSDNEGTPVSLLEALAAGIPVVSTCVGGVPDLLGAGFERQMTPPGNAAALAAAWLETLAAPPPLDEARKQVLDTYSLHSVAAQHMQLYRELLASAVR
jgi:glycosyltransferase involved in cell wall biosynthesis